MAARLLMTVHVIHRAGEAVVEPVAQTIEPVGVGRRGNAGQLEAQRAGLLFQAIFQGSHASILKRARPARSASKGSPQLPPDDLSHITEHNDGEDVGEIE
jgi:hypothetical protein